MTKNAQTTRHERDEASRQAMRKVATASARTWRNTTNHQLTGTLNRLTGDDLAAFSKPELKALIEACQSCTNLAELEIASSVSKRAKR